MNCPKCKGFTKVMDKIYDTETNEGYRKRKCDDCGHLFYSIEFEIEYNENVRTMWKQLGRIGRYKNRILYQHNDKKKKKVICLDTGEIFDSVTDAAKSVNVFRSAMSKCCSGSLKTCGGMRWAYYKEEKENQL